ncbi:MAG: hypothetical protein SX243_11615 [Acidobacteriota bacterium]|nr:hypothetical protein [Acidobacteriota bacterium]
MRKMILVATCVLALVGPTVVLGEGSEANADELLLALLSDSRGVPVIHRGGLPEGLEMELPEASRLVGSAEWPDRSRIIVRLEASLEEARTALVKSLESQGWVVTAGKIYGFVHQEIYNASLCREEREALNLWVEPAGSGASLASLGYRKAWKKSPCLLHPYLGLHNHSGADIFPTLVAPGGARKWGGGGGGTSSWRKPGDSHYRATVLESALSVPELIEHYGEQMKQAGWKLTDQVVGEEASVQFWTLKGEKGKEFFGTFVVLELSDGTVEANLRITLK